MAVSFAVWTVVVTAVTASVSVSGQEMSEILRRGEDAAFCSDATVEGKIGCLYQVMERRDVWDC